MEIYSEDWDKLRSMVQEWKTHPEIELEATFGPKGTVDMQTFLRVASRFRSKGFESLQQEDRLTVSLPDQVRFTLSGPDVIKYCRDNQMAGKNFVALIKDREVSKIANHDIREYDLRVKSRREISLGADDSKIKEILANWNSKMKYFRLIRRWTFKNPKVPGLIFDLSMVRSTQVNRKTGKAEVRTFQDQPLASQLPVYEIEVEVDRSEFKHLDDLPETEYIDVILVTLLGGIGDVLRGVQGTSILIGNTKKIKVLEAYAKLVGTDRFRGVGPVTLENRNMTKEIEEKVPNIRKGYNVTDKADGLRVHAFTDENGELFMIDMAMNVYKTGLLKRECSDSLLDGEYVTVDNKGKGIQHLLLFDIYIRGKNDISRMPFQGGRWDQMEFWMSHWRDAKKIVKTANLHVATKSFHFASADDLSIFVKAKQVLSNNAARIYNTDGLIFTPNKMGLPSKPGVSFYQQFKWKPSEDNTVDFLISIEKDLELKTQDKVTIGIRPDNASTVRYKTLRLFVGSSRDQAFKDPRDTILSKQPLPETRQTQRGPGEYKPVLFHPNDFPDSMANVCYLETEVDPDTLEEFVSTERSKEPIRDKSIVEMRYDPQRPPGWRWIPIRVRADKTERLARGEINRSLNNEFTAESVWNSIHEPVTESMITTGAEQPTEEEQRILAKGFAAVNVQDKYWERKASYEDLLKVRGMRDFHNRYIKDTILYGALFSGQRGKTLLDIAAGKAGDLQRWIRGGASFVLGVDYAADNILNPADGAYSRLLSTMIDSRSVPPIFFAIGDGSKRLITGEAAPNEQEADILRSILGRYNPSGAVPPLVEEKGAGELKGGVDTIACMFAIHYFFKDEATFNGFLQNISDNLKVGGLFAGVCFDGQTVFDSLRGIDEGKTLTGVDKESTVWEITKQYNADELPLDERAFGLAIDVNFISIGTVQREYLVSWPLLVRKMKSIGCELLTGADLERAGLKHSTNLLSESYVMADKSGQKFYMSGPVKRYSFMNRWFVFKRVAESGVVEGDEDYGGRTPYFDETTFGGPGGVTPTYGVDGLTPTYGATPEGSPNAPTVPAPPVLAATAAAATAAVAAVAGEGAAHLAETPRTDFVTSIVASAAKGGPMDPSRKTYAPREVFNFYASAASKDAQWVSPSATFPINHPENPAIVFPTMEHFMAGMSVMLASSEPVAGPRLFSRDGAIHQKYLALYEDARKKRQLTADKEKTLLADEITEVKKEFEKLLKKKGLIDPAVLSTKKQFILDEAVRQRLTRDKRFCQIMDEVLSKGQYVLYYTKSDSSEMGGQRHADGTIGGQNKLGKTIMNQIYADPAKVKQCATGP